MTQRRQEVFPLPSAGSGSRYRWMQFNTLTHEPPGFGDPPRWGPLVSAGIDPATMEEKKAYAASPVSIPLSSKRWPQVEIGTTNRRNLLLPRGLTLLLGRTGRGKTLMMKHMVKLDDRLTYVNVLEPFGSEEDIDQLETYYDLDDGIARGVELAYLGYVPILDSLRILTYISTGAQGKGGVNKGMFGYFTALNNCLARKYLSMVAAINPLLEDDESFEAFLKDAESSAAAIILATSRSSGKFSTRAGDPGEARVPRAFTLLPAREARIEQPSHAGSGTVIAGRGRESAITNLTGAVNQLKRGY